MLTWCYYYTQLEETPKIEIVLVLELVVVVVVVVVVVIVVVVVVVFALSCSLCYYFRAGNNEPFTVTPSTSSR